MVMSVCAFSRASRSTFTTLFKLGSGQVEQLQLKLSRVGRSSTRYSPLTQNSTTAAVPPKVEGRLRHLREYARYAAQPPTRSESGSLRENRRHPEAPPGLAVREGSGGLPLAGTAPTCFR